MTRIQAATIKMSHCNIAATLFVSISDSHWIGRYFCAVFQFWHSCIVMFYKMCVIQIIVCLISIAHRVLDYLSDLRMLKDRSRRNVECSSSLVFDFKGNTNISKTNEVVKLVECRSRTNLCWRGKRRLDLKALLISFYQNC